MTPRDLAAVVCFAASLALLVVAFARRRSTGRWFPLLVAAMLGASLSPTPPNTSGGLKSNIPCHCARR